MITKKRKIFKLFFTWIILLTMLSLLVMCKKEKNHNIMTVVGEMEAEKMGITLPHEHVLVDFIGADSVSKGRYDPEKVFNMVLPYLQEIKELGCNTFIECTPAYLGRDPELLLRLSEATGLNIITNTGYYGARQNQHLPDHTYTETAEQLAERWTDEWLNGIDNTTIRPGFIKIAIDRGELSDIHKKIVRAAAITHLNTGLTIASHTGTAPGGFEEIETLKEEGVDPSAFIWVHAQAEENPDAHIKAAKMGAWISFDGLGWTDPEEYVTLISNMKSNGLLDKVLISHDAGWYHVGEPGGGDFKGFTKLFNELIPALRNSGFSDEEINILVEKNPVNAYSVRVRKYNN